MQGLTASFRGVASTDGSQLDGEAFVLIGAGLVVLRGPARFTQRRRDAKNADSTRLQASFRRENAETQNAESGT